MDTLQILVRAMVIKGRRRSSGGLEDTASDSRPKASELQILIQGPTSTIP